MKRISKQVEQKEQEIDNKLDKDFERSMRRVEEEINRPYEGDETVEVYGYSDRYSNQKLREMSEAYNRLKKVHENMCSDCRNPLMTKISGDKPSPNYYCLIDIKDDLEGKGTEIRYCLICWKKKNKQYRSDDWMSTRPTIIFDNYGIKDSLDFRWHSERNRWVLVDDENNIIEDGKSNSDLTVSISKERENIDLKARIKELEEQVKKLTINQEEQPPK